MYRVPYTHHIPGRLRVRTTALKHDAAHRLEFREWLESVPGVTSVEMNAVTGSALIHYDVRIADGDGLMTLLCDEGWVPAAALETTPRWNEKAAALPVRRLLRSRKVRRAVAKAVLTAVAEAALERSIVAIVAAIL